MIWPFFCRSTNTNYSKMTKLKSDRIMYLFYFFDLFFTILEREKVILVAVGGRMVAPIFFLIIVRHLLWVYRPDAFFLTSGLSWVEEGQESVSRNLLQYNYRCGWGLQNHFFINMYLACWNLNTFGVKLLPFSFFR